MSRILYIPTHEYPPTRGGIAFYIEESARAAAQSGWQVHVLAPDKATPDRVADGTHNGQLHVHRLPLMGNQNWPDRLRTWQAMSRAQEDWSKVTLWLAEPGPLRLWTYDWFLPLPKPERLIVTLHGSEFVRAQRWPHRRFLLNRLLLKANRVGVVSEFVADIVCGALPRLRNKLVLVPGALRSAFPVAEVFPESDSRHIGSDQLRILTVGRMHPRKGQLHAVQSLALLPEAMRKRITWMVVGPTVRRDYEQEVLNVAKQAGVKVERLTDVNDTDLRKLYRECHVMLFTPRALPGSIEGLGLVSLEAAASGLPIVATASGGVAEGLEPNVNALLVPEGDLAATANALLRLLNSNDLWQKFASAGPGIATRFSWQRNVSQLLD